MWRVRTMRHDKTREDSRSVQAGASWADHDAAQAAKPKVPRRRASRREISFLIGFELLTLALGLLILWALSGAYHGQPPEWLTNVLFNFGPLALMTVAIVILQLVVWRVRGRRDRLNKTRGASSPSP